MTTKKLAGKPKGNANVPIPFPTPTRCSTQTPGALKREKSQRSDPRPPRYSIWHPHRRAVAKVGQNARAIIQFEFDIDLLESKPFKTTNATLRLCFSDTLTYQKRSKKGKMETRARATRAGDRRKKKRRNRRKNRQKMATDRRCKALPFGHALRACPSGMPFGHALRACLRHAKNMNLHAFDLKP